MSPLHTLSRHIAAGLLLVFTLGGVLLPAVHEVEHGLERQALQVVHENANGHHHHAEGEDHGVEFQPPCSKKVDTELTCVLCHGFTVVISEQPVAEDTLTPNRQPWQIVAAEASRGSDEHILVRGPPAQIV